MATIIKERKEGDLVVFMSNGGFGGVHQKLLDALGESPLRRGLLASIAWQEAVTGRLERAVARALSKRPEDRYAEAGEMRADLQAVEETGQLSKQGGTVLAMPSRPSAADPVPPLPSPLPRAGGEGAKRVRA